jgi:CxxC-x17-CxxC domain-containing protein
MVFQDKMLTCSDCGTDFTFSSNEQEFFASKGYTNEPRRCIDCRQARKKRQKNGNGYGDYRAPRRMFSVLCTQCGRETEVPFEPREDRPVYCGKCYSKVRISG